MTKSGGRVAAAVVIGYLLGRTRRMKLALTVGGVLAGRRLSSDPKELLGKASKLVSASPELSKLSETLRGRLVEAATTAATAAVSNKIDALGDSLTERAAKVRAPSTGGGDRDGAEEASEEPEESTGDEQRASGERAGEERQGEQQRQGEQRGDRERAAPRSSARREPSQQRRASASRSRASGESSRAGGESRPRGTSRGRTRRGDRDE